MSYHPIDQIFDLIPSRFGNITERKFNTEVFIFRRTELAESEQLDLFDASVIRGNVIKSVYAFTRIVDAFNDHLTKPGVDSSFLKLTKEEIHRFFFASGIFKIIFRVAHFIVEQTKIGHLKQLLYPLVPDTSRGIESGVYSFFSAKRKKLADELSLQSRLAARNGNTAVLAEILAVSLDVFKYIRCGNLASARWIPGIGIVAISASERTSLHKKHKTHAGTVNGPERLYRINSSCHIKDFRGRYG